MPVRRFSIPLLLIACSYGQSTRIFAPDQTLNPGQSTITSLSLISAGQSIAAIQFDLEWDKALGLHLTAGGQLWGAAKIPYSTSFGSQKQRYLVAGMNQTAIADGELLKMFLSVDPSAALGSTQVAITNVIASDPNGMAVPVSAASIHVQIQSGIAVSVLSPNAVVNAASLSPGPLSPGEIITLFGFYALPSVAVRIGGTAVPVLYADASQVNAIVPFGLDLSSTATLELKSTGQTFTMTMPVASASPGVFTANGSGLGSGAILNEDFTVNSFDNPAHPGSIITVYGTGFGSLQAPVVDGQVAGTSNSTAGSVSATIAGIPAEVLYAGSVPGLVAGVTQINVRVPVGVVHNPNTPLILTVSGSSTQPATTVTVQ